MEPMRHVANSPRVFHQIIDDELVLIHLETGFYYSAGQMGADIWELLVADKSPEEIVDYFRDRDGGDRSQIESQVLAFLSELGREQLLTEIGGVEPAGTCMRIRTGRTQAQPSPGPVVLHKYGEMAELIIHGPDGQFYMTDRYRPQ